MEPNIDTTREVPIGPAKFMLSMLSYAQMQAIMEATAEMSAMIAADSDGAGAKAVELRDRTILWSLNNVYKWPDDSEPFGSETKPFTMAHVKGRLPFPKWGECLNDLHLEVLRLNNITVKKVGESEAATANESTGAVSAPDSLQTESAPLTA